MIGAKSSENLTRYDACHGGGGVHRAPLRLLRRGVREVVAVIADCTE